MSSCEDCGCVICDHVYRRLNRGGDCEECGYVHHCGSRDEGPHDDGGRRVRVRGIDTLLWVQTRDGKVPEISVEAGDHTNNMQVYVGRVFHNDELIPGKIIPELGGIFISKDGKEYKYNSYYALSNPQNANLTWEDGRNGVIPSNAVVGGRFRNRDAAFIVRHRIEKDFRSIGTVRRGAQFSYYPWLDKEVAKTDYDILVCND